MQTREMRTIWKMSTDRRLLPTLPAWMPSALASLGFRHRRSTARLQLNGKTVTVEWSRAAAAALARRPRPLIVELELYFSCLVKKFVHFHETSPGPGTVEVTDKLQLIFRSVTSTACSMDIAQRLGRQPEMTLDNPVVRKLAPQRVWLDHRNGTWRADYWL